MAEPRRYPAEWVRQINVHEGLAATIRPIRPGDAAGLVALFARLSRESVYYRFFFKRKELGFDEASHLANVDFHERMAFVVELEEESGLSLAGVARYEPVDSPPAAVEMAVVVIDEYQHHGLGRLLVHTLGDYALSQGYRLFLAEVLADNYRMVAFCRHLGYPLSIKAEGHLRHIWLTLQPSHTIPTVRQE